MYNRFSCFVLRRSLDIVSVSRLGSVVGACLRRQGLRVGVRRIFRGVAGGGRVFDVGCRGGAVEFERHSFDRFFCTRRVCGGGGCRVGRSVCGPC